VLADESRRVRAALRRLLEDEGFHVVTEADNGIAAVADVRRSRPEVALLDVRLPGLDGLSAATEILRHAPGTRVVICTAVAGVEDPARKLGAFAVVAKGSHPTLLVGTIHRALAHAHPIDTRSLDEETMRRPA
jgi:two-component system, NarL family, response regulator DesR